MFATALNVRIPLVCGALTFVHDADEGERFLFLTVLFVLGPENAFLKPFLERMVGAMADAVDVSTFDFAARTSCAASARDDRHGTNSPTLRSCCP
jgi:hypothetical protein